MNVIDKLKQLNLFHINEVKASKDEYSCQYLSLNTKKQTATSNSNMAVIALTVEQKFFKETVIELDGIVTENYLIANLILKDLIKLLLNNNNKEIIDISQEGAFTPSIQKTVLKQSNEMLRVTRFQKGNTIITNPINLNHFILDSDDLINKVVFIYDMNVLQTTKLPKNNVILAIEPKENINEGDLVLSIDPENFITYKGDKTTIKYGLGFATDKAKSLNYKTLEFSIID